jgi:hypothetical protein
VTMRTDWPHPSFQGVFLPCAPRAVGRRASLRTGRSRATLHRAASASLRASAPRSALRLPRRTSGSRS